MTKVSSVIKDYKKTEKGLEVTFQSGHKYLYADVPANVILGLDRAESKGTYFHAEIRDKFKAVRGRDKFDGKIASNLPKFT